MIISTPGRICLFGEHQDYLGLPVIALAISLRARIEGERRQDKTVRIRKPDLNATESFSLEDLSYTKPRDYFKSAIKTCMAEGLTFPEGFECELTSSIPIRAGTSSSAAIMVSWIHFLSRIADDPANWKQQKIGELAYKAEVLEFNEPGGMMDQYSTAIGHLIYLQSEPEISIESMNPNLGTFVLGDSVEPKDTMGILQRCRNNRLSIIEKMKTQNPDFNLHTIDFGDAGQYDLTPDEIELLIGTIKNRDYLRKVLPEFQKMDPDHNFIGKLLSAHHTILRDVLKVSTPKIESMLDAAMDAGALGGKINGSGGGGCMFAYAPDNPEAVAEAIESVGGKAYIIHPDEGTRIE
ncbi:hypothetical protein JYT44_03780 [Caldithrix abyssi]|nr:hypothetical protein [Caldithrix abyssi]